MISKGDQILIAFFLSLITLNLRQLSLFVSFEVRFGIRTSHI
ncbi:hypothetical protein [Rubritalea tangerina]